ncbi:MAG: DUF2059 domain-containing protein [Planctomycetota bacterium]|nr:DUF2059 domain-containing protein [Planctomycetota bacterium]
MKAPWIVVVLVLSMGICGIGIAVADDEDAANSKRQDIKKLVDLQNSKEMGIQVMKTMLDSFRSSGLDIPDDFIEEFLDEVLFSELLDQLIPIYEKHLTHQEVKELIKFFESPVGKMLIQKQPLITQESMVVGMEWGRKVSLKVLQKLRDAED